MKMRIFAFLLCIYHIKCYILPIIPKCRSLNVFYAADTAEKYDESLSRDLDSQQQEDMNDKNNNKKLEPSKKITEKTSDIIDSFLSRFESFDGSNSDDGYIPDIIHHYIL